MAWVRKYVNTGLYFLKLCVGFRASLTYAFYAFSYAFFSLRPEPLIKNHLINLSFKVILYSYLILKKMIERITDS